MRESGGPELRLGKNKGQLIRVILSLLVLAAWIWILDWLFVRYTATSYFKWYLKNGTMVSVATAFFALVWNRLEVRKSLLSWHPLIFLAACMVLAGVFYEAVAVNLGGGTLDGVHRSADDPVSVMEALWDSVFALIMNAFMGLVVLGWLLVIAPGFYVLTLFTGAPARREIRGTDRRLVIKTEGSVTTMTEQPSSLPAPGGAIDLCLGTDPFALTNALNAAVLFSAKVLITGAA